jgi:hypothetical protein
LLVTFAQNYFQIGVQFRLPAEQWALTSLTAAGTRFLLGTP